MRKRSAFIQLYLRLALGIDFMVIALDRFGVWGANGSSPNVSWGDWKHFSDYAHQVMFFLPYSLAEILAVMATICELAFGAMLIIGLYTRWAAIGSGLLTLCFAICMIAAFGISSPINYSVFVVSAGSFLLATLEEYKWSVDELISANKKSKQQFKK